MSNIHRCTLRKQWISYAVILSFSLLLACSDGEKERSYSTLEIENPALAYFLQNDDPYSSLEVDAIVQIDQVRLQQMLALFATQDQTFAAVLAASSPGQGRNLPIEALRRLLPQLPQLPLMVELELSTELAEVLTEKSAEIELANGSSRFSAVQGRLAGVGLNESTSKISLHWTIVPKDNAELLQDIFVVIDYNTSSGSSSSTSEYVRALSRTFATVRVLQDEDSQYYVVPKRFVIEEEGEKFYIFVAEYNPNEGALQNVQVERHELSSFNEFADTLAFTNEELQTNDRKLLVLSSKLEHLKDGLQLRVRIR